MEKDTKPPSDTVVEIGQRVRPRRYRRFKDLHSSEEVIRWVQSLDWQNNPYDRFLLRREILHRLESTVIYKPHLNIYKFVSRTEIEAEVDSVIEHHSQLVKNHPQLIPAYDVLAATASHVVINIMERLRPACNPEELSCRVTLPQRAPERAAIGELIVR